MGLFKWVERLGTISVDCATLGRQTMALRVPNGIAIPDGCVGVVVRSGGNTRRVPEGARLALADGELATCFHPGPYNMDVVPFAAAPELGLQLQVAVNTPDPRVAQQRFDLFLSSEAGERLELATFTRMVERSLQHELAQGNLELPPCTTNAEWNQFRAGLNQLLYTRFGVTVDDCVPVDLGQVIDFAAALMARATDVAEAPDQPPMAANETPPVAGKPASVDAHCLRRLFLELPGVMQGLRLAVLPSGQELFQQQQALLQRLDALNLAVNTMPSLAWAAPGQPLPDARQARRASHSLRACAALDEAWALLARLSLAQPTRLPALFDEADRIIANLELDSAERRIA